MASIGVRSAAIPARAGGLKGWRLAAFSSPAIPLAAMSLPMTVYLPDYYATELGLSLGVLAFVFMIVRLFDLWADPALGFAMDKTNTRFGRFRPWVAAGAPLSMISTWMLFMAEPGVGGDYLLFWLVAAYVGQSMVGLGLMAWAAVAAPAYDQRSQVYGWATALQVFGMIAILALPPVLRGAFDFGHVASIQAMGWFVIVLLPPTMMLAFASTGEPPAPRSAHPPRLRHYWELIKRPSVLRVLAADICWGTGPAISGGLFFFYFDAIRGLDRGEAGVALLLYFAGALIGTPLWTWLAGRIGKHKALMAAGMLCGVSQAGILILPVEPKFLALIAMALAGLPFTAGPALLRAMMADLGDEERLESGIDRTALLFSLLTGSVKIGSAIAVGVGLSALGMAGFEPRLGAANSEESLLILKLLFAVVPAALGLATVWLISFHRLDGAAHEQIRLRLAERDGLGTPFE